MPPYRPQFAFRDEPGFEFLDFDHYYDQNNTPGLNIPPGGNTVYRIPLNIDPDADFCWRGTKFPMAGGLRNVQIRFRDPSGNYLSDGLMPAWLTVVPPSSSGLDGGQCCVQEPEILCPAGSTVQLDVQYSAPEASLASPPVLIGPGGPLGSGLGSYSSVQVGAVQFNAQLWQFVSSGAVGNDLLGAYLSVDNGHSWMNVDPTHSISGVAAAMYWDGVSNIVTFLYTTGSTAGTAAALIQFDLAAQVWGAPFGTGGAPIYQPFGLWIRTTGDYVGLFQDLVTAGHPFKVLVFSAGAWGAAIDITTGAQALPGYVAANTKFIGPSSVMQNDVLYTIFSTVSTDLGPPNWDNRFFFQVLLANNALGSFNDFPGQSTTAVEASQDLAQLGSPIGRLVIVGGALVWGIVRNGVPFAGSSAHTYPAVYVGSPLPAPVWVESGTIDPNDSGVSSTPVLTYASLFYDSHTANLYSVYSRHEGAFGTQICLAFTNVAGFLSGWRSQTIVFDAALLGIKFYPLLVFGQNGVIIGMSFDITTAGPG